MSLLHKLKLVQPNFSLKLTTSWWVKIITAKPHCTYYFGPFESFSEAKTAYPGYVEDLESEAAEGIIVNIKSCKPEVLTAFNGEEEISY